MVESQTLSELRGIVGKKHVLTSPEDQVAYSYDGTFAEHRPDLIVRPDSTKQVSQVMEVAWRAEIPVVPRGMASGMAAASVPLRGGMVLDTCRLNQILEIDEINFTVTTQAGVITQDLADAAADKGMFYPPDPSSIKQSTLGGNAACNAGGPRCLKYGVTSDYVMGMTVVLADGRILQTGGKAIKNVTGYNLTQLFVGSEGTLGVITELTLKLIPLPLVARTAKAAFPRLADACQCVNDILCAGITPATMELMDETTIATIEEAMHLGLPLDVEAILIIESDGMDEESVIKEIETIADISRASGARDVEVARTEEERAVLWSARRSISPSLARRAPNKLGEDISVPRSAIPDAVAAIKEVSRKHDIPIAIFGHAGDGNLHPNILFDKRDPASLEKVKLAAADIFDISIRLGGTLSGEHGVGDLKMAFMEKDIGPLSIEVMSRIKQALDPKGILNPGKVIPDLEQKAENPSPGRLNVEQSSNELHTRKPLEVNVMLAEKLATMLENHADVLVNPARPLMIYEAIRNKEATLSANGALNTWTPPESTGRSPLDTYIVRHEETAGLIDWDSPNCIPLEPETFDMIVEDAVEALARRGRLYVTDRVLSADPSYALPVRAASYWAATALFTDNMFRAVPPDLDQSVFSGRGFTLVVAPCDKLDRSRYDGRLRKLKDGQTSDVAVAMDFDRRLGVVIGSAYAGSVKKMMFTVANYLLPSERILPLHCSANEGPEGDIALLLGLSGTGKTTLSADPRRALLGDDEHGWSDDGVANFENGCYAKLIDLREVKEPEIWNAVLHEAPYLEHGAIVENAMIYSDGSYDLDDDRLTPNSRASYPLSFLSNIKTPPVGGHPKTILFLTADANGVLPPVSRLTPEQAMLWFLMGYTSKLAGTETGIVDPVSTFSRFFGEPFMPLNPDVYASMLGERMKKHGSQVYLVNTGWSGGPFGVGARMDIDITRSVVQCALSGGLDQIEFVEDERFHIMVPRSCAGVPLNILNPRETWEDKEAFDLRAQKLACDFSDHFDRVYGGKGIDVSVASQCPGK